MSCPSWEYCNKKSCIEQYTCMNGDYWSEYWKNKVVEAKSEVKERKKIRRAYHYAERTQCVKKGDWCDKKRSCEIMGQCIFTIPRFADKPEILNALRGPHTPEQVIKILREHDPEPMRSYYFCQKRQKK